MRSKLTSGRAKSPSPENISQYSPTDSGVSEGRRQLSLTRFATELDHREHATHHTGTGMQAQAVSDRGSEPMATPETALALFAGPPLQCARRTDP